ARARRSPRANRRRRIRARRPRTRRPTPPRATTGTETATGTATATATATATTRDRASAMATAEQQEATSGARILVIDNYDSFVYTIVGYLEQMGASTLVVRNDAVPEDESGAVDLTGFDGVLVSPGPGNPDTAGRSLEVIGRCAELRVPMLGVCLGHQALGQFFGATVDHSPQLMHGRTSELTHEGASVFAGVPSPLPGAVRRPGRGRAPPRPRAAHERGMRLSLPAAPTSPSSKGR